MNILFLCTGNSCRSQMAEGFLRHLADDQVQAFSAGLEAHGKNPRAIAAMAELGIAIQDQESTRVSEAMMAAADVVVTVCGHAEEHCPHSPAKARRFHWPLPDPAGAVGSEEDIMRAFRRVRDDIQQRVSALLTEVTTPGISA